MIAIVDYGVGNLFSLESSFRAIGAEAVVTGDKEVIKAADKIVLPGVGAFEDAAKKLFASGLAEVVIEEARAGKDLLGICLGMQLLFDKSFEYGEHSGLGLISGEVRALSEVVGKDLKIPHIGWNALRFGKKKNKLFKYLREGEYVYFVHSFYGAKCENSVIATTEYGAEITAAVADGNIYGCQFHPEKSGDAGLKILRAFAEGEDMKLFPAIDLYEGKAVRLYKGDYNEMTVYSHHPEEIAEDFYSQGARFMHVVDLEGAKSGGTPNISVIQKIISRVPDMFVEVGGGIRSIEVADRYISAGVKRVILGTAAVTDREFLKEALRRYGEKIAVGVDIKDGFVAIKGWREKSALEAFSFCRELEGLGVKTVICTDISKDGAMMGTNHALYQKLSEQTGLKIIASGGVSSIDDVKRLADSGIYGAIIGKAYYTGAISIKDALKEVKKNSLS